MELMIVAEFIGVTLSDTARTLSLWATMIGGFLMYESY